MRKGRGVGYLGKEVQCSHFRVWGSKPTREMQRAVLRAHWRFMIINLVTTASTVIFVCCVKLDRTRVLPSRWSQVQGSEEYIQRGGIVIDYEM